MQVTKTSSGPHQTALRPSAVIFTPRVWHSSRAVLRSCAMPKKRTAPPKDGADAEAAPPKKRSHSKTKQTADGTPAEPAAGAKRKRAPAKQPQEDSSDFKPPKKAAKKQTAVQEGDSEAPAKGLPITGLWLMKNEPEELSLEILQERPNQTAFWDGVRNYQARNFMRQMKIGDQILFYYSSCKVPGIAGIAKVVKLAYPDHTAWDPKSNYYDPKSDPANPRWDMVDVQYVRHLPRYLPLEELRRHSGPEGVLEGLPLFTRFRLSVMPVEQRYWDAIMKLAEAPPAAAAPEAHGSNKKGTSE